jgi:hypothetical protein
MNPALLDSEIERAMRQDPQSLDAWNAAMRGWWHFDQFTQTGMGSSSSGRSSSIPSGGKAMRVSP